MCTCTLPLPSSCINVIAVSPSPSPHLALTTSLPYHISPFPLSLATTVLPVSPAGPPLHSLHRQPSLLSIEPRPLSWSQIGPVHYQEPHETCVLLPRHHGAHEACRCLPETVSSHGSPGTTLSQGAAAGIQLWLQTSGVFATEDSQDSGESTEVVRFWYDRATQSFCQQPKIV